MTGHRKRLYLALPNWAHELHSTNRALVPRHYSDRMHKQARKVARKLLRCCQKKQDCREIKEQLEV